MTKLILIVGLVILGVSICSSMNVLKDAHDNMKKVKAMQDQTEQIHKEIKQCQMLPDAPAGELKENLKLFYEYARNISQGRNYKRNFNVNQISQESAWVGLKKILILLSFSDFSIPDDLFHVLKSFELLNQKMPFDIYFISQEGNKFDVHVSIYGK